MIRICWFRPSINRTSYHGLSPRRIRRRPAAASAALQNHDVADAQRLLKLTPEAMRGWEQRHLHSRLDDSSAAFPFPAGSFLIAGYDQFQIGIKTSAGVDTIRGESAMKIDWQIYSPIKKQVVARISTSASAEFPKNRLSRWRRALWLASSRLTMGV